MPKKRGRGRPKKCAREKASAWLGVAVTVAQKQDFVLRAQAASLTPSRYLRLLAGIDTPAL